MDDVFDILQEHGAGMSVPAGEAPPRAARAEKRPRAQIRNRLISLDSTAASAAPARLHQSIEMVGGAIGGGLMIVGWADDTSCPIDCLVLATASWRLAIDAAAIVRTRRTDVEEAIGAPPGAYGFFAFIAAPELRSLEATVEVTFHLAGGGEAGTEVPCRAMTAEALRDLLLGYLASCSFLGNHQVDAARALDGGMGDQIIALNRAITGRITAARHVERFGAHRRQPLGSIVVCLYGKPEFLFVQNALFSGRAGIEDFEFIFVSNSPEMAEALMAEARAAHMIYGLRQTIVLLPGNAGFGAANNAAVSAALGRRILNVNPDVFPRDPEWAARHTALIESQPAERTRLFGIPLYYDDGSLMHGGMYVELDAGITIAGNAIERRRLARVEHYGKGAPDWAGTYTRARPVPALTGAFISSDRAHYEKLGGFTEDFVFGHYEDADLCFKSLAAGTPAWLQDLRMWHLEGKGSTRRPHHEGGSLVNRWLFTRSWHDMIASGVNGPNPGHKLLQPPAGEAAPTRPAATVTRRRRNESALPGAAA